VLIGTDGKTEVIREAETLEDIDSREKLPGHLKLK
jgi:hypothetical protein